MKFVKIKLLLIVLITIPFNAHASKSTASDWKQIYDKDGIVGFERSFPGTKLKEFKAVGFVAAKIEVISQVLRDIPAYPHWMAKCKEAKLLEEIDENSMIFYNESASPWPVKNRGVVIKSETNIDPETGRTVISFKAIKDDKKFPVKKGVVQIVDLNGNYLIEFFGRDMTRITYTSKADPAGKLSISMANIESRLYPVINLKGLRKMVKIKKYRKLALKSKDRKIIETMISSPETIEKVTRNSINEFVFDPATVDLVFENKSIVEQIIKEKASYASIKNLILATCKAMLTDERIRKINYNKELYDIMAIDKFFNDRELAGMITKDTGFVGMLLDDRDVMKKILTDKALLGKITGSKSIAKKITANPELVIKMLRDEELKKQITEKLPKWNNVKDFQAVIKKYIASYEDSAG